MSELAVVTGAARGIGAAVARRLAAEGVELVLVDACAPQPGIRYPMPSVAELEAVAAACGGATIVVADAADGVPLPDGCQPTIAVAVAGGIAAAPSWATPEAQWDAMLRVNLHATRRLAEATVPAMRTAGYGRFVAVASVAALRAMPHLAAYSAAKAAVTAYVRAMAADLAGTGVTANVVCPGSTRGAMLAASAEVYGLPSQESFAPQQLTRRLLEPEEVAAAIAWLCRRDASAPTGAVLPIDGGLSA